MTTFSYFLEILIKVPPSEKKKFRNFALFVQLGFLPSPWEPECFPGGSVAKNPPVSAGDTRNMGSLSGSGRSPGEGNAPHSSILIWEIRWTEEHGGLYTMGLQRVV